METVPEKNYNFTTGTGKYQKNYKPIVHGELLTREETAEYLQISLSTLWHWSKKEILPSYGIGHRMYYKRRENDGTITRPS